MHDTGDSALPRWRLDTIYSGFGGPDYGKAKAQLAELSTRLVEVADAPDPSSLGGWLRTAIDIYNRASDLFEELSAFAYTQFSVNTRDETAGRELNAMEEAELPLKRAIVLFRNSLAQHRDEVLRLADTDPALKEYRFFLLEQLELQKHQMSPAEEEVAADLNRAGGEAWSRLQEAMSSTLTAPWDEQTGERKTVIQLRALAFDPDRTVRERAYRREVETWKRAEVPLAYSINGVKGFTAILTGRRGWDSALDRSIMQARISGSALDALIGVMRDALPLFRTYLRAKAQLLGLPRLAFYDLFAPVGEDGKRWSFVEARELVIERFRSFSSDLAEFAAHAFAGSWIDAEPREGKVGGAYCISFPLAGESRVLCNFDGSFSSVSTVAHELGHAYHHHVLKDAPAIHRDYPMTLAETASIFAESLVFEGALAEAGQAGSLPILEAYLSDSTQVIVDILSRFIFEQALMSERTHGELSPERLSSLMIEAQKETYGDALDPEKLHPYMWAVKPHYYRTELSFYNFPYAFGQLFGLALYGVFDKEGPSFADRYVTLLQATGRASATEITAEAGFDIATPEFWQAGIELIGEKVRCFGDLVAKTQQS